MLLHPRAYRSKLIIYDHIIVIYAATFTVTCSLSTVNVDIIIKTTAKLPKLHHFEFQMLLNNKLFCENIDGRNILIDLKTQSSERAMLI